MRECRDCRRPIRQQMDKAIGEPRDQAWQAVWTDDDGSWVCTVTGDEHDPEPI